LRDIEKLRHLIYEVEDLNPSQVDEVSELVPALFEEYDALRKPVSGQRLEEALEWEQNVTERGSISARPAGRKSAVRYLEILAEAARTAESAREQGFREAADIVDQWADEHNEHVHELADKLRSLSPDDGVCEWTCAKDRLPLIGRWVLLCIKGVVQREAFYLDQGDNGPEYWDRDDLEEGLMVNDDDYWILLPDRPDDVKGGE